MMTKGTEIACVPENQTIPVLLVFAPIGTTGPVLHPQVEPQCPGRSDRRAGPGLILESRQRKPKGHKKTVLIIDASREFKTGRAQNELLPDHVEHIYSLY